MTAEARDFYRGRRVLVAGGLGFIGSNLCIALAGLGARVTAVDSLVPDCGGNVFNLAGYEDAVALHRVDLRDAALLPLLRGQEVVFNLAGQVSHVDSMRDPVRDLEINARSPLCLLEALRQENREARVVYAGTRQVYGRPRRLPVDEQHPVEPTDVNGVDKLAGELYHLVYHAAHGLRASSLRLSNTYGERQLIRHNRQGFIGWFVGQAVRGEEITVFGDGRQKRDFNHVSDVVDAFLRAGASAAADGRVFNLGGGPAVTLLELAHLLVELAGRGSVRLVPFPEERKSIDIGDFCADTSLVRETLGWKPRMALRDGLARTVAFYREHGARYQ